jgi:rubrerythrin
MSMSDSRVPGNPTPGLIEYRCPVDGYTIMDEIQRECPDCGTLMEPVADPYAERRRKLRKARKT